MEHVALYLIFCRALGCCAEIGQRCELCQQRNQMFTGRFDAPLGAMLRGIGQHNFYPRTKRDYIRRYVPASSDTHDGLKFNWFIFERTEICLKHISDNAQWFIYSAQQFTYNAQWFTYNAQ
jgi:hypothetical protein